MMKNLHEALFIKRAPPKMDPTRLHVDRLTKESSISHSKEIQAGAKRDDETNVSTKFTEKWTMPMNNSSEVALTRV